MSILSLCFPTQAQIASDRSMITPTQVRQLSNIWDITKGTESGINLFHSFIEFSVKDGDTVRFINDNPVIQNIVGRVTGVSTSEIFGRIEAGGTASNFNLFLLNPNGIIFGQNASLNLNGSFIATTADAIQFGESGYFSASSPSDPSLLTVQPSAFFFNQYRPNSITNQSRHQTKIESGDLISVGLQVPNNKSLVLLGGDVTIDGGRLTVPNGRIELGGLVERGTVYLNMNGDDLSLSFSDNVAKANVLITNRALINVTDKGRGRVSINAQNIEISRLSKLLSGNSSNTNFGSTETGNIRIDATSRFVVDDSTIQSSVLRGRNGNSSDIFIQSESLSLINGGRILTLSSGQGNAGDIIVNVRKGITIEGQTPERATPSVRIPSQITSILLPFGEGKSGDINLKANSLSLVDSGLLFTSTGGQGNAGNIIIRVDDTVSLKNSTPTQTTSQIRSAVEDLDPTLFPRAMGNGGTIDIQTRFLSISEGSLINSSLVNSSPELIGGKGRGGNIIINASDSVNISGVGANGQSSGIFASSQKGAEGQAGNITINTPTFRISEGAQVTVSSPEQQAGNLSISAQNLSLKQGLITAETGNSEGDEGANITLQVSDLLTMENESLISATANGSADGGNINIDTPFLVAFPPTGPNGSDIIAKAEQGNGGRIAINAQGIFGIEENLATPGNRSNDLDASSEAGASGEIILNRELDPNRGLIRLPENVIDPNALIAQNACKQGSESEFVITGRGGLPSGLNSELNSEATQIELVEPAPINTTRPDNQAIPKNDRIFPSTKQPIIPAQGWVFNEKGEIVLVSYNPTITGPQRLPEHDEKCSY
ncbi:MAG: filamentous hemagglutinin N-terminal domain-containing protein [Crocosphaera sp.]